MSAGPMVWCEYDRPLLRPRRKVSLFAAATDLFPTFLEAAGIPPPRNAALDGMSLIPGMMWQEEEVLVLVLGYVLGA